MKQESNHDKPPSEGRTPMLSPELSESLKWDMYRTAFEMSFLEMFSRYYIPKELRGQLLGPDITDDFADGCTLAFVALRAGSRFQGITGKHPLVAIPTDCGFTLGDGSNCYASVAIEGESTAHLEVFIDRQSDGQMSFRIDVVPGPGQLPESEQAR